jgi:hypothetical protein
MEEDEVPVCLVDVARCPSRVEARNAWLENERAAPDRSSEAPCFGLRGSSGMDVSLRRADHTEHVVDHDPRGVSAEVNQSQPGFGDIRLPGVGMLSQENECVPIGRRAVLRALKACPTSRGRSESSRV